MPQHAFDYFRHLGFSVYLGLLEPTVPILEFLERMLCLDRYSTARFIVKPAVFDVFMHFSYFGCFKLLSFFLCLAKLPGLVLLESG